MRSSLLPTPSTTTASTPGGTACTHLTYVRAFSGRNLAAQCNRCCAGWVQVCCPELALVSFVVKDKDVSTAEVVGQNVIPLGKMRTGHRMLPLYSASCTPLRDAYLFLEVAVTELASKGGGRRTKRQRKPRAGAGAGAGAGSSTHLTVNPMMAASPRGRDRHAYSDSVDSRDGGGRAAARMRRQRGSQRRLDSQPPET